MNRFDLVCVTFLVYIAVLAISKSHGVALHPTRYANGKARDRAMLLLSIELDLNIGKCNSCCHLVSMIDTETLTEKETESVVSKGSDAEFAGIVFPAPPPPEEASESEGRAPRTKRYINKRRRHYYYDGHRFDGRCEDVDEHDREEIPECQSKNRELVVVGGIVFVASLINRYA